MSWIRSREASCIAGLRRLLGRPLKACRIPCHSCSEQDRRGTGRAHWCSAYSIVHSLMHSWKNCWHLMSGQTDIVLLPLTKHRWYTLVCLQHLTTVELGWDHKIVGYSNSYGLKGTSHCWLLIGWLVSSHKICTKNHKFWKTPISERHTCAFLAGWTQYWLCHIRWAQNVISKHVFKAQTKNGRGPSN